MAVLDEFTDALAKGKVLGWLEKYSPKGDEAENFASTVLYKTYMKAAELAHRLHEEEKKKAACIGKAEWSVVTPYFNVRFEYFGDTIVFQVIEQRGIPRGFRKVFNGITFMSESHPDWVGHQKRLYLRGINTSLDNAVLKCSKEEWQQISKAIDEFDAFYGNR